MFVDAARAKEFECAVCLNIYEDPVQIGCEDHIFCKKCIDQLISTNGDEFDCPLCKVECTADDVSRVKFVARQIGNLQVKCPNTTAKKELIGMQQNNNELRRSTRIKNKTEKEIGKKRRRSFDNDENESNSNHNKRRKLNENESCKWQGSHSDFKNHIKKCPLQKVPCEYCDISILQREVEEHESICPLFPLECIHCGEEEIDREDMEEHISVYCTMTLIKCDECKQEINRGDEIYHLQYECEESLIKCVFYKFGCKDKLKRKDKKNHVENAAFTHNHLVQISNHQLKLENTVNELKNEIKSLNKKVNAVQNKLKKRARHYNNTKVVYVDKHDQLYRYNNESDKMEYLYID